MTQNTLHMTCDMWHITLFTWYLTPENYFFFFFFFKKKLWILLYWCYYPHRTRHSVSPVCGIFRCMSHLLKCLCNSVIQSVPHHFLKPESPRFRKKTLTAWQHCCSEIWETWQMLQKKSAKFTLCQSMKICEIFNKLSIISRKLPKTSRKLLENLQKLSMNFQIISILFWYNFRKKN